jgi:hypothetical protein
MPTSSCGARTSNIQFAPSRLALTLRAVGGLTSAEIEAAYAVPEAPMAQRISRATKRIRQPGAHFEFPAAAGAHRTAQRGPAWALPHLQRWLTASNGTGVSTITDDDVLAAEINASARRRPRSVHAGRLSRMRGRGSEPRLDQPHPSVPSSARGSSSTWTRQASRD